MAKIARARAPTGGLVEVVVVGGVVDGGSSQYSKTSTLSWRGELAAGAGVGFGGRDATEAAASADVAC